MEEIKFICDYFEYRDSQKFMDWINHQYLLGWEYVETLHKEMKDEESVDSYYFISCLFKRK